MTAMTVMLNQYGHVKDDLRAQLYLRVLGNELAYGMLDGSDVKKLRDGKAQSFFDDLAKKLLKDGEVALTQSAMFMDTTMVIPTGRSPTPLYPGEETADATNGLSVTKKQNKNPISRVLFSHYS